MKKTYPGQSNAIINYCIRAIIIGIVMLCSALLLSATAQPRVLLPNIFPNTTQTAGVLISCNDKINNEFRVLDITITISELKLFLKGTINKRLGFSRPGLI